MFVPRPIHRVYKVLGSMADSMVKPGSTIFVRACAFVYARILCSPDGSLESDEQLITRARRLIHGATGPWNGTYYRVNLTQVHAVCSVARICRDKSSFWLAVLCRLSFMRNCTPGSGNLSIFQRMCRMFPPYKRKAREADEEVAKKRLSFVDLQEKLRDLECHVQKIGGGEDTEVSYQPA